MIEKLYKAIRNNNGLYEAIFNCLQLEYHKTDAIWYSLEKVPPLYSNLVTLSSDWRPDEVFRDINLASERGHWRSWTIKDSFAVLDLEKFGFRKLFDAKWIYLEIDKFIPGGKSTQIQYKTLNNEADLFSWRMQWDSDEQLGKEIFTTRLLGDPNVYFIAGYQDNQFVCGCMVNKTDDVLGISNYFPAGTETKYWPGMLGYIFNSIGKLDVVGYEREVIASSLQPLGFESIGNLTIWLKKRTR